MDRARLFRRAVYAWVPILLIATCAELAARWMWEPASEVNDGYLLPAHATRIWSLPPGMRFDIDGEMIQIDGLGLRMVDTTGAALRILTLGDSNVFGHGLRDADTLHVQLQSALADRGIAADVICGGVPGYSTTQTVRLLDEVGWSRKPDLLVVANGLSDAARENFTDEEWVHTLDRRAVRAERLLFGRSQAWLWIRSRLREKHRMDRRVRWVQDPNINDEVRVSVRQYRENLDKIMLGARTRGVGVVILVLATQEHLAGREPGMEYRETQDRAGIVWQIPVVDGVKAVRESGMTADEAFMDLVHGRGPTQRLYATGIADVLANANWPDDRLIPKKTGVGNVEPARLK